MSGTITAPGDLLRAERAIEELLRAYGLDPEADDALRDTPRRVARSFTELFAGVGADAAAALSDAIPLGERYPELVAVSDLMFASVCEHHLLPFVGVCSIVYAPGDRVIGIGRFADALRTLAARPQVQERLGEQLAQTVFDALEARGVLVLIEASHGCFTARGPGQAMSRLVTVSARGNLRQAPAQADALALIRGSTTRGGPAVQEPSP